MRDLNADLKGADKRDYLKNPFWDKIARASDQSMLEECIMTGGSSMEELPFSPILLKDKHAYRDTQKILDFGCGIGRNFKHFNRFYEVVHGYDIPSMIKRCRDINTEKVDLITSDWNTILSNKYDLVAAQYVFQHFLDPSHVERLLEDLQHIGQYLYISGRCYMDSPRHDNVSEIIFESGLFEYVSSHGGTGHSTSFPSEEHFSLLFKSKAFEEEAFIKDEPPVAPSESHANDYIKTRVRKSDNEDVDIIILTKNNYKLTEECILSVIKHVSYPKYRITLFDTGSKRAVIKKYKALVKAIPQLFFKSLPRYHFSRNYNAAIDSSKCSYIMMLNNDTVALSDFVSEMMKYILNNKVGAVGCQLLYPDNTIQHAGQMVFDMNTGKILPHLSHHLMGSSPQYVGNRFTDGVTCACLLVNKEVYKSVDGMSIEYDDIFQDVDLNLTLRKNGYEIYLTNATPMVHKEHGSRNEDDSKIRLAMLGDTHTFQEKWANHTLVKDSKRGTVNLVGSPLFSFVTLVNDEQEYSKFLGSIETNIAHEFIGLKNYGNFFDAPRGLNVGAELSSGKYIVFCHQDITLCKHWCELVLNHICSIEEKDNNWGVLGIAGSAPLPSNSAPWATRRGIPTGFLSDGPPGYAAAETKAAREDVCFEEVETLDELLLLCKNYYTPNTSRRYFDPTLGGFHFYGADLCLNYLYNFEAKSYTINCPVTHASMDGSKNLQTSDKWEKFAESAERFRKKWSKKGISRISTTTCSMDKDGIEFYFTKYTGK